MHLNFLLLRSPHLLLQRNGSQFQELAQKMGKEGFDKLKKTAEAAYGEKLNKENEVKDQISALSSSSSGSTQ